VRIGIDLLAERIVEKRGEIRDLVTANALARGVPVRPFPPPSPPDAVRGRIPEDPAVPFRPAPGDALTPDTSSRHIRVAMWIALFGGLLGLDRLYLGYRTAGLIKLFTAGGLGYLWLRDIGLLTSGRLLDADGLALRGATKLKAQQARLGRWTSSTKEGASDPTRTDTPEGGHGQSPG
jgi:TM2 domain-containing membrane protein YozV